MTRFERLRQKVYNERDAVTATLDKRLATNQISNEQYWKEYKELMDEYSRQLKEIDSDERTQESLVAAEKKPNEGYYKRPEYSYVDALGQLKATKLSELFNSLTQVSTVQSSKNTEIEESHQYYKDVRDPIALFEEWWAEELEKLPSLEEVKTFLSRISIHQKGYLVYDDRGEEIPEPTDDPFIETFSKPAGDFNLLNRQTRASMFKKDKNTLKKEKAIQDVKKRKPLLAAYDLNYALKHDKKQKRSSKRDDDTATLEAIVTAYNLPIVLEDLLFRHIDEQCIPKGLTRPETYQTMLSQFLRFVQDNNERIQVVKTALEKGWRILGNGTV